MTIQEKAVPRHERELALSLLSTYLFFLSRRPVSSSNSHYLAHRISGLKSLAAHLDQDGSPQSRRLATSLYSLNAANFRTMNRDLQCQLALVERAVSIPPHYIITDRSPGSAFLKDVRRVLLICGPAIGIGDEIILFPLPRWLKAAYPAIEVMVMSGYPGLWDRVVGPDSVRSYSAHEELMHSIQGAAISEAANDRFDLIVMADFEKPGLAPVLASSPCIERYLELSLGGECCIAVDNINQRISAVHMPLNATINYYQAMERLLAWGGIPKPGGSRYPGLIRREPEGRQSGAAAEPLRIFVSPFTSKYDPALIYWSTLLGAIYQDAPDRPVEFHIDPGANLTTERFSSALARSAAPRAAKNVRFCVASMGSPRTLDLSGVFACMERSDVVICADSFAAHAGPLFGLPTLVVARAGLENWRTPASSSYYFDVEQPAVEIGQSARVLIDASVEAAVGLPHDGITARLDQATRELSLALCGCEGGESLNGEYHAFVESYRDVVSTLAEWPREYRGMLRDTEYAHVWRQVRGDLDAEGAQHLKYMLAQWENTNLRKLLHLAACAN